MIVLLLRRESIFCSREKVFGEFLDSYRSSEFWNFLTIILLWWEEEKQSFVQEEKFLRNQVDHDSSFETREFWDFSYRSSEFWNYSTILLSWRWEENQFFVREKKFLKNLRQFSIFLFDAMRFYENSRNVFLKNQHPTLRNIPFSCILTYLFHFFPADRTRYFYKIFERIFSFKKKKIPEKWVSSFWNISEYLVGKNYFFFFRTNFCHSRNMAVSRRERRATLSSKKNELRRRIIWEF